MNSSCFKPYFVPSNMIFLSFHNWSVVMAECCSSCLFLLPFPVFFFGNFLQLLLNKFFTIMSVFHVHWFLVFYADFNLSLAFSLSILPLSLSFLLSVRLRFCCKLFEVALECETIACLPGLCLPPLLSPFLCQVPPRCLRSLSLFDHLPLLDVHQFMLILSGKLYLHFNFMKE